MKLPCGCELPEKNGKPYIDYDNINLGCPKTWDLLAKGHTAGIFQLENPNLGGRFSKKIQPKNIKEVADVIAIIRPGTLQSKLEDGESATAHFCHRHTKKEIANYPHDLFKKITEGSYGIIVYQEQTIEIAKKMAKFTPAEAMKLLKGIAKKKADVVLEFREKFVNGCISNDIKRETAEYIYDMIEKSARYQFNLAHSIGYAQQSVICAYTKAHFPVLFMCASLRGAGDKPNKDEEIKKLVLECEELCIPVLSPSFIHLYEDFTPVKNKIYFGATNIKSVGETQSAKLLAARKEILEKYGTLHIGWYKTLMHIKHLNKSVIENCIKSGVFMHTQENARKMLSDYKYLADLTGKSEKDFIQNNWEKFNSLEELVENLLPHVSSRRIDKVQSILKMIKNPPETLKDNNDDLIENENKLLGVSVSANRIDLINTDYTIDSLSGKSGKIVVEIRKVKIHTIKHGNSAGKEMAFLEVFDRTGTLDIIAFSNEYDEFGGYFVEGRVVEFCLQNSKGWIVTNAKPHGIKEELT